MSGLVIDFVKDKKRFLDSRRPHGCPLFPPPKVLVAIIAPTHKCLPRTAYHGSARATRTTSLRLPFLRLVAVSCIGGIGNRRRGGWLL